MYRLIDRFQVSCRCKLFVDSPELSGVPCRYEMHVMHDKPVQWQILQICLPKCVNSWSSILKNIFWNMDDERTAWNCSQFDQYYLIKFHICQVYKYITIFSSKGDNSLWFNYLIRLKPTNFNSCGNKQFLHPNGSCVRRNIVTKNNTFWLLCLIVRLKVLINDIIQRLFVSEIWHADLQVWRVVLGDLSGMWQVCEY